MRHTNHTIATRIVAQAERTPSGIALEELGGIRQRARLRKPQRVALRSRAFAQLGRFFECKARRAGVPLVFADPAHPCRGCAECGRTEKRNRISQAECVCRSRGVVAHAGRNVSRVPARGARTRGARHASLPPVGVSGRRGPPGGRSGAPSRPGPSGPGQVDMCGTKVSVTSSRRSS
nr:zinc ribbon domain-containing protein [Nocardiopsis sp. CNT312]